ncbi:EAL domain-containing protein [Aquipuribacter sp. SD81]|uniref:EAL domain-containing protein n=1 Tax=Aquipuribacter sp. SD81 TaxID=3127703 RepID=UPI00301957DB
MPSPTDPGCPAAGPAGAACASCTCARADGPAPGGGLLLASAVGHTLTALRSLARRLGTPLHVQTTGLLRLDTDAAGTQGFLAAAAAELTPVEAAEVRVLGLRGAGGDLLDGAVAADDLVGRSLLARAMRAPSLATEAARRDNAHLLPLLHAESTAFHSVFQPIVRLEDPTVVVGHEALLRAVRDDGTPVMPGDLFAAAEQAGWTNLLDRVGRTTALRDAGPWLGDALLFINFVPTSIYRPEVCLRTTERAAALAGVRLEQVVFEVVESHDLPDVEHLERVFAYYRSQRCKVALDDLGSGFSSLNRLVRLRPDLVKLDRELVQSLPGRTAAAVVEAVVRIVGSYGGQVLAEGVETREQAAAARALGVELGQGWLFGRPVRREGARSAAVPSARRRGPTPGPTGGQACRAGSTSCSNSSTPLRSVAASGK